jgi:hypothetical protein
VDVALDGVQLCTTPAGQLDGSRAAVGCRLAADQAALLQAVQQRNQACLVVADGLRELQLGRHGRDAQGQ